MTMDKSLRVRQGLVRSRSVLTRAERTDFAETSLYADVVELVGEAVARSEKLRLSSMGRTAGGLDIPLVVVSERGLATPRDCNRGRRGVR